MDPDEFDSIIQGLDEPTLDDAGGPSDETGGQNAPEELPTVVADGLACEVCGTSLVYSGRGRKPKRCPEHRKSTTVGAKRATATAKVTNAQREELISDLTRELAFFGTGMSKALPVAGVTLFRKSEQTAKALVKLAGDNPRLLGALELTAKAAAAVDLGDAGASVGVAVLVDLGRMSPDAVMSQMLGVSATWHEIHDEEQTAEQANDQRVAQVSGGSVFEVPVPARFERIT